jgi:hypothetical protein
MFNFLFSSKDTSNERHPVSIGKSVCGVGGAHVSAGKVGVMINIGTLASCRPSHSCTLSLPYLN